MNGFREKMDLNYFTKSMLSFFPQNRFMRTVFYSSYSIRIKKKHFWNLYLNFSIHTGFLERILRVPSLILLKPATADQGWLIWNNKKGTKPEILGTLHKVKTCQKEAFYDLSKWIGPNPVGIFTSSFKTESWLCLENLA